MAIWGKCFFKNIICYFPYKYGRCMFADLKCTLVYSHTRQLPEWTAAMAIRNKHFMYLCSVVHSKKRPPIFVHILVWMSHISCTSHSIELFCNYLPKDNIQIFTRFPFKVPHDKTLIYGDWSANVIKTLPRYYLRVWYMRFRYFEFCCWPFYFNAVNAFSKP